MSAHRLPHDLMMAPYERADPGDGAAIVVDRWNVQIPMAIAASSSETGTLATPTRPGQKLCLVAASVGSSGSRAITVATAINKTGNTVMTFDAAREIAILEGIPAGSGTYRWQIINDYDAPTLS